jgi:hypothetical protein
LFVHDEARNSLSLSLSVCCVLLRVSVREFFASSMCDFLPF